MAGLQPAKRDSCECTLGAPALRQRRVSSGSAGDSNFREVAASADAHSLAAGKIHAANAVRVAGLDRITFAILSSVAGSRPREPLAGSGLPKASSALIIALR